MNYEKGITIMTQTPDTKDWHGYHAVWCNLRGEPHDEHFPFCEYQVGGVEAVTEPGWSRSQLWVSTITSFLHGTYTPSQSAAEERNRTGVQLSCLVYEGGDENAGWTEKSFNIRSGEARSLAAQLIAAADISEGINRTVRHD
jgi:hypothetical protein